MKRLAKKRQTLCLLVLLVITFFLVGGFLFQNPASAQLDELTKTAERAGLGTETEVSAIVGRIIGIVFTLLGIILLVLIIVGGVMWMTSGGGESQIKTAKAMLKNAFIGLIIVILAYAISRFVIANLSKVTEPSTPSPPGEILPDNIPPPEDITLQNQKYRFL